MRVNPLIAVGMAVVLASCASKGEVNEVRQKPTKSESPYLASALKRNAQYARNDLVITVGECKDKTGQFKDTETLRYSRAVTQACGNYLYHILDQAGFRVVDRNKRNLNVVLNQYKLAQQKGPMTRNRQTPGLLGASAVWSAAISSYSSSVTSGGGGVEILGAGINAERSVGRVEVISRISNMTSEVMDTSKTQTWVVGQKAGFRIARLVDAFDETTMFSAEIGSAIQMPVDMAFQDALIASVATVLKRHKDSFYTHPERVQIDLSAVAKEYSSQSMKGLSEARTPSGSDDTDEKPFKQNSDHR
jgi:curli biogenesis system outer membrane secretion channel CsgG